MIIALLVMLAANIATLIYQGTTDTTDPPVIECSGGILDVTSSVSEAELLVGITARDNQDGDLTDHVIVASVSKLISNDTAKVTYLVFDSDDNMASFVRKIRYTDYRKPRFQLNQPLVYNTTEEVDLLSRLGAHDRIDGDISDKVRFSTLASTEDPDIFDVTVQVTNSMGDTASVVLPVMRQTVDPTRPEIRLTSYLQYVDKDSAFDPMDHLERVLLLDSEADMDKVKVQNWVDTSNVGTYRVFYTYTDDYGTGTAILTVVVQ